MKHFSDLIYKIKHIFNEQQLEIVIYEYGRNILQRENQVSGSRRSRVHDQLERLVHWVASNKNLHLLGTNVISNYFIKGKNFLLCLQNIGRSFSRKRVFSQIKLFARAFETVALPRSETTRCWLLMLIQFIFDSILSF